jgi:hypothetical protein
MSENLDATKGLETKIEDAAARLTGQMQGLQIGLQAILDAGSSGGRRPGADHQFDLTEAQQSTAIEAVKQQNIGNRKALLTYLALYSVVGRQRSELEHLQIVVN